MSQHLYNSTVIPEIIELISKHYNIDEKTAMDNFYKSKTLKALNDKDTGLYGQSSLYIFSVYQNEQSTTVGYGLDRSANL